MSWKTEPGQPRNDGRIFSVMGKQYIFRLTDAGILVLYPYTDPWVLMQSLYRQHEKMMASLESVYDHEVWVGDMQARLKRRQEKARTFTARYAGNNDHRWRTQIPHDDGKTGRMVIHDIPFQF